MKNLSKEYDKFMSMNDERYKQLDKEDQFYISAIGYGVKYYDLTCRIDKAIEYIEKSDDNENSYGDYDIEYHFKKELLDILKGNDTNE